jgi:threonine dehydratase
MPNAPREFAAREGLCCVHACDDPAVVAGRGTVGLEIIAGLPGCGVVAVRVVAVEPEGRRPCTRPSRRAHPSR